MEKLTNTRNSPTGTVTPLPCDTIAICPAGTTTQTSLVGITSAVIIDFFLIILFIKVRIGQLRQAGEPSRNVLPEFIRKRLSKVNENGQKVSIFIFLSFGLSKKLTDNLFIAKCCRRH